LPVLPNAYAILKSDDFKNTIFKNTIFKIALIEITLPNGPLNLNLLHLGLHTLAETEEHALFIYTNSPPRDAWTFS
jgi:hypothetical protein